MYLRGQKHESYEVLPDMAGISVTFNHAQLSDPPEQLKGKDEIIVVTQVGAATRKIMFDESCKTTEASSEGGG